jgi:hypothetical protein
MEGKKNDFLDKKLRWDLLPLEEIEDIVKVYTAGSIKYGDNNWQNLENGYQRYKAAMLRHLLEYEKGNTIDKDTDCHHLAQVAWNAIAMLWISKHTFRKATVEDLSKALDERIEEKINNCNDILDKIQLSSQTELDRREEAIAKLCSYKDRIKDLVEETIYEYNKGKSRTGDSVLSDSDKQVSE